MLSTQKFFSILLLTVSLLFLGSNTARVSAWTESDAPISVKSQGGYIQRPYDIAVDDDGNMYVVVQNPLHRVLKFNAQGVNVLQFGENGSGNGQFQYPSAIVVDHDGNIYVSDAWDRIQKFDSEGNYLLSWGTYGLGNSEFRQIQGLAVDSANNIYTVEDGSSTHYVKKFSNDGTFITKWGSQGSADGEFSYPGDIWVSSTDEVYVADSSNNRIQKFTSAGVFITKFDTAGTGDGGLGSVYGVSTDAAGNIYYSSLGGDSVQKISSSGTFLKRYGQLGTGDMHFNDPQTVRVDSSGNVYVADYLNHRVQKLDQNGSCPTLQSQVLDCEPAFQLAWSSSTNQMDYPDRVAHDSQGNFYVIDSNSEKVFKFTASGVFVTSWGGSGSGDGQFNYIRDIAIDGNDNVFVVEQNNHRVQKFTSNGTFISKWGNNGSGNEQFNYPRGIAIDAAGNVYVADRNNSRVSKFTNEGAFLMEFSGGDFGSPTAVAVDSLGKVYASYGNLPITVFNSNGTFSGEIGAWGTGDGEFDSISDMYFDSDDNLYVVDDGNGLVQKISKTGTFLWKYVAPSASYTTDYGYGIDVVGNERFYITDGERNRFLIVDYDRTAPSLSHNALSSNETTDTTPEITGNATDVKTAVTDVEYSMDETGTWENCTANDSTFNELNEDFSCQVATALSLGAHTIKIRATDSKTNTHSGGSIHEYAFTVVAPPAPPTSNLDNVYFTFSRLRYGKYATPYSVRWGDHAFLKNFNPSKVKVEQIFLYDYAKKGNQGMTKKWIDSKTVLLKSNYYLPVGKRYAYVMKLRDKETDAIATKYFVFYTAKTWNGKSTL